MNDTGKRQYVLRSCSVLLICILNCLSCECFQVAPFFRCTVRFSKPRKSVVLSAAQKDIVARRSASTPKRTEKKNSGKRSRNYRLKDSKNSKAASELPVKKPSRSKRWRSTSRREMLDHDILTAQEEQSLGMKLRRAIEVKEAMSQLVEQKHQERLERGLKEQVDIEEITTDLLLMGYEESSDNEEDLNGLSVYDMGTKTMLEFEKSSLAANSAYFSVDEQDLGLEDEDYIPSVASEDFFSDVDICLTEEDIVETLGIPGGRDELTRILIYGSLARDKLISCNIRLVVSIAKKWFHQSALVSGEGNDNRLTTLYAGSWTRPSLDEAIQEGILGLATAADRFEPQRKLKFGTYATYWITSFIRKCFQQASTGCLRVPPYYHVRKQQYQKIVTEHFRATGESTTIEAVAEEMGLTVKLLRLILKSTESLVSIDGPAVAGSLPGQGGKAGSDDVSENNLLLSNTLSW